MFLTTWFVSNLLLAALAVQLVRRQVYFELPFFTACISFRLIQAIAIIIALSQVQFLSRAYLFTWFITESIAIVLVALTTTECYLWLTQRIFRLGRIGSIMLSLAGLLGLAAMVATSVESAEGLSRNLANQFRLKQALMSFFSVSLGALLAFYRRFPLHVPKQAWPHALVQVAYLAIHAVGYAGMVLGGTASTATMNEVLSVAWIGCLSAWLWIFRNGVTWPQDGGDDSLARADEQAERLERLL